MARLVDFKNYETWKVVECIESDYIAKTILKYCPVDDLEFFVLAEDVLDEDIDLDYVDWQEVSEAINA